MAPTSDDNPETFSREQLGAWSLQNDPYTIEGELEGFSRFATGVRTARKPWLRFAGLVMVTAILGPMVFGLLSLAWRALFG